MRTIVLERPGELLLIAAPEPPPPRGDTAVVRVLRVGVCGTDVHAWRGEQPFFTYPRVLGHELAVEVVAVGPDVTDVGPGDRCAVEPYLNCGACRPCRTGRQNCCERLQVMGVHLDGGMRDLIEVPTRKLHPSRTLPPDALALVEMLSIGAHAVRRSRVSAADTVLVLGAGPIGLGVASFARAAAARVCVADVSASRLDFCESQVRPDALLNVSSGDLEAGVIDACGGELPSIVFDATGNAASMRRAFRLIGNGGTLVLVGLILGEVAFDDPDFHRRETTLVASRNALPEDFRQVLTALEERQVDATGWITHRTELEEASQTFPEWTRPEAGVVKGIIEVGGTDGR